VSGSGSSNGRQRGAALLIALLAVALAALLASELVEQSQRDVARTTAVVDGERAWQYAEGADGLARAWIRRLRQGGPVEPAPGQWTQPFPVPGGSVRARMLDQSGRFNLNALASTDPTLVLEARRSLAALLAGLDLEPAWLDRIVELYPSTDGRPALLAHLSELNRLPDFTSTIAERLLPLIAVLPEPGSRININRAAPEVLAAVLEGLSPEAARALSARGPFDTLDRALAQPELSAVDPARVRQRLSTESRWFLVHAQVVLNGRVHDFFRRVGPSANGYDARYVSRGTP
jgi:general secretion pathway protein K